PSFPTRRSSDLVTLRELGHPRGLRLRVVTADRDEGQVRGGEAVERTAGRVGGGPDLLEALCVARGLEDIGAPAVALPAGPGERGVRAPADADGRERLDGLRVERDRLEPGDPALERRGRVAPERPHDVDALADARPAVASRDAAELELFRVL